MGGYAPKSHRIPPLRIVAQSMCEVVTSPDYSTPRWEQRMQPHEMHQADLSKFI